MEPKKNIFKQILKKEKMIKKLENLNQSNLNKTTKLPFVKDGKSFLQKSIQKVMLNQTQSKLAQNKKGILKNSGNKSGVKSDDSNIQQEEEEKVKELGEVLTSSQKAMNLIDDTLDLLNNNNTGNLKSNERYDLIDKKEYAKMIEDNEKYRKEKKQLYDEYCELKDKYDRISRELGNLNANYYNVERTKCESITKIYVIEDELKKLLVENCRLQSDINFEFQLKDNVFKAIAELQQKYTVNFPPELYGVLNRIQKEEADATSLNVNNDDKLSYLEKEVARLEKEVANKNKEIERLTQKQQKA